METKERQLGSPIINTGSSKWHLAKVGKPDKAAPPSHTEELWTNQQQSMNPYLFTGGDKEAKPSPRVTGYQQKRYTGWKQNPKNPFSPITGHGDKKASQFWRKKWDKGCGERHWAVSHEHPPSELRRHWRCAEWSAAPGPALPAVTRECGWV